MANRIHIRTLLQNRLLQDLSEFFYAFLSNLLAQEIYRFFRRAGQIWSLIRIDRLWMRIRIRQKWPNPDRYSEFSILNVSSAKPYCQNSWNTVRSCSLIWQIYAILKCCGCGSGLGRFCIILPHRDRELRHAVEDRQFRAHRFFTFFQKTVILCKKNQDCGSGLDLDTIGSVDPDSGSGSRRAKMTHKSRKKLQVHVLKCWMASFESWRLLL